MGEKRGRISAAFKPPISRWAGAALLVAASVVLLSGCAYYDYGPAGFAAGRVTGSGNVVTRAMGYRDFTNVEAHNTFKVDIVAADSYSVAITADDNLFEHLDISKQGRTLKLGLKRGSYGNTTLQAEIGMPNLRSLNLSGAASGTVAGFNSRDSVGFNLSGASSLVGRLDAGAIDLVISGASSADLEGSADRLDLNISGASRARLDDLSLDKAKAKISGASSATVNVARTLDADLSGASTLHYRGNPTLGNISTTSGSSLKRK